MFSNNLASVSLYRGCLPLLLFLLMIERILFDGAFESPVEISLLLLLSTSSLTVSNETPRKRFGRIEDEDVQIFGCD